MVRTHSPISACILTHFTALDFAKSVRSPIEGTPVISVTELQWFYQASYRVGLKAIEHRQLDLALHALKHSHEVGYAVVSLIYNL